MPKYFIGNVLSAHEKEHIAENDPTFAFSLQEAKTIDLSNLPIRMEHDPDLEVGKVMRNWQANDGSVWVVGKLNDNTFESKFANYAIEKNPTTGEAYYTGLSLQHTHIQYASKVMSKKEGIEVSLCVNPRRSDCRIAFVDYEPNQDKTKKIAYKIHSASFKTKMSMQEQNQTPTEENKSEDVTPNAESQEAPAVENTDKPFNPATMTPEDYQKVIIELSKKNDEYKEKVSAESKELQELKEMIAEQKKLEEKKVAEKSYALAKATIDQWAETLDQTEMDQASRESIMKLAQSHPAESMAMLRVAHCASTKHKATTNQFEQYKEMMQKSQLQTKFEEVMSKKRPSQAIVHAASQKKAKTSVVQNKQTNVQRFLTAMNKYNVSGSARDHMEEVSKIGARRRGAPYY